MKGIGESAVVKTSLVFALLLAPLGPAWSQPFGLDQEAPEAVLIEFSAEPGRGEFVGRAEGSVDASGKRFYLKGINIMAPLVLQVLAKDPARPVEVSLHRLLWEEDEWRGRTDANGDWGYVGRVYEEIGIQLHAAENAGFYVLAWQGPAVEPKFGIAALAPTSVGGATPAEPSSSSGGLLIYVGIAIVIAILVALLWRRRSQSDTSAVTALAVVGVLMALGMTPADAAEDLVVVESDGFRERLLAAESRLGEMHNSLLISMKDIEAVSDATFRNFDQIVGNLEDITQLGIQHDDFAAKTESQIEALRAQMRSNDRRHDRLIAELRTLIEEDREAEPDPTVGGATLESSCVVEPGEDETKCGTCFVDVNKELTLRLHSMEQARVYYDTNAAMVARSIEVGDAGSGWTQLDQAQWNETRQLIRTSERSTQTAYNQYYDRAFADLHRILKQFELCEREAGGMEDWFERRGLMFYTILKSRYERTRTPS